MDNNEAFLQVPVVIDRHRLLPCARYCYLFMNKCPPKNFNKASYVLANSILQRRLMRRRKHTAGPTALNWIAKEVTGLDHGPRTMIITVTYEKKCRVSNFAEKIYP